MLKERGARLHAAMDIVIPQRNWSRPEIEAHQWRQLKALVEHAYANVPMYRCKYDAAGFQPEHLKSLADLELIPLLTKEELRGASSKDLKDRNGHPGYRWLQSSGSTGMPAGIWRDEGSLWHFMAQNTALYYEWCQGSPIDKVLYFLDMAQDSIDYALADLLRTVTAEERIVSVTAPVEEHLAKMGELQPEFISSYPSAMRSIAMLMRQRGMQNERLKLLHLTSEMLNQRTRDLLAEVFPHARVIETYTSTESGLIAWECLHDKRWHLAETGVIGEILTQRGGPADGTGRLIITDLTNWATPVIRYAGLGDLCAWETSPCPCGSLLRSLCQMQGRVADILIRRDGTGVSPYRVTNALDEVAGICQYQVVQHVSHDFEVFAIPNASLALPVDRIASDIRNALATVMGEEHQCEIRWVSPLSPKANRHKVSLVTCHLQEGIS